MKPSTEEYREVKSAVMAGMETGNTARARTVLTEFAALHPVEALSLSTDVASAYGIVLL